MPTNRLAFKLKNKLNELDCLNEHLDRYSAKVGLTNKCRREINLALEEIFANYVSYGHSGIETDDRDHQIDFNLSLDKDVLTIRIDDDGKPFDPQKACVPHTRYPLEARKVGGLGIYLTKKLINDIGSEALRLLQR